jgi:hypothetical protein
MNSKEISNFPIKGKIIDLITVMPFIFVDSRFLNNISSKLQL